jgi:DNA-binding response OmpR family regulator
VGAYILIVEDDEALGTLLRDVLTTEGYETHVTGSYHEAEAAIAQRRPDLILLDIVLPDVSGLIALANLRSRMTIPIVLLSATRRGEDPIIGLKLGADDFIAKPFNTLELTARIQAVLRRSGRGPASEATRIRLKELTIDRDRREVWIGDRPLEVTATEFRLLNELATHCNTVVTREQLARALWPENAQPHLRVVDVHIRRLRQKLAGANGAIPTIRTVRGFGYRLTDT